MSFATPTTQCKGETWDHQFRCRRRHPSAYAGFGFGQLVPQTFEEPARTEIVIVLSFGSDNLTTGWKSNRRAKARFGDHASSSRSAVVALFRRTVGGPQIQGPFCCAVKTHSPLPVLLFWHHLDHGARGPVCFILGKDLPTYFGFSCDKTPDKSATGMTARNVPRRPTSRHSRKSWP